MDKAIEKIDLYRIVDLMKLSKEELVEIILDHEYTLKQHAKLIKSILMDAKS